MPVEAQAGDPGSVLSLYRTALRLRRSSADLQDGELAWQDAPLGVLDLTRGRGFRCVVNLSAAAVPLPAGWTLLLASDPATTAAVAPDSAAWLASAHGP